MWATVQYSDIALHFAFISTPAIRQHPFLVNKICLTDGFHNSWMMSCLIAYEMKTERECLFVVVIRTG